MRRSVLLYDGDCGFCRWMVARLLAWDQAGNVRPLAIQSAAGQNLLASLDAGVRLETWHLVTAEGCLYSGGAAAPPLMRSLPGGTPLAWLTNVSPKLTDTLYRMVADRRSLPGRLLSHSAKTRARRRIDEREAQMSKSALPARARPCPH
jgi:predicted DCC family thiol-disulfide oxidoreductase YuxK